jgi:hypothetical protein
VALAAISCASQALGEFCQSSVEGSKFIAGISLRTNDVAWLKDRKFNLIFRARVSTVVMPGHFDFKGLNLMTQELNFVGSIEDVLSEPVRD